MARIYLDYASLTLIHPRVIREIGRFSTSAYANPSSIYTEGVAAKVAMERGRKQCASFISAHTDEIIFTGSGTEANNLALRGLELASRHSGNKKAHIIVSSIEHSSIMECVSAMEKEGAEVTRISVSANGIVNLEELKKALRPETLLVSIMTVNNETGVIQPIKEIADIIKDFKQMKSSSPESSSSTLHPKPYTPNPTSPHRSPSGGGHLYPYFHTDASQAASYFDLNVTKLGVDLMTIDGGKVYGPRGIGMLYIKRGTAIESVIQGGGQEGGLRSGTENLPAIMGLALALQIASANRDREFERLSILKDFFIKGLLKINPDISINGAYGLHIDCKKAKETKDSFAGRNDAPHILNVAIPGIDGEFFALQLDAKGISCSTKSSCLRDENESYVMKAMGMKSDNVIRFSFGRSTKKRHLNRVLGVISSLL